MRKEFQLTPEQVAALLEAGKPTPAMYLSGGEPMFDSPQENANRAWAKLGKELGFKYMTVRPVPGKGHEFFTAEEDDGREVRHG